MPYRRVLVAALRSVSHVWRTSLWHVSRCGAAYPRPCARRLRNPPKLTAEERRQRRAKQAEMRAQQQLVLQQQLQQRREAAATAAAAAAAAGEGADDGGARAEGDDLVERLTRLAEAEFKRTRYAAAHAVPAATLTRHTHARTHSHAGYSRSCEPPRLCDRGSASLAMQHLELNTGEFGTQGAQATTSDAYAAAAAQQQQQQVYLYARQRSDPGRDWRAEREASGRATHGSGSGGTPDAFDSLGGSTMQVSPRGGRSYRLTGDPRATRAPQPRRSFPAARYDTQDHARAARLSQPHVQPAAAHYSRTDRGSAAGLHAGPPSAPGPGGYAPQQQQYHPPAAMQAAASTRGLPVIRGSRHSVTSGAGSSRAARCVQCATPLG